VSEPALASYRRQTRRAMRRYAMFLLLIAVTGFIAVRVAYAHGELNKVSNRVAPPPAVLPSASPGASLSLAWRSDDHPAGGDPYSEGVIVSFLGHTVNGRDATTGAVRWFYTRSDMTVCSVVQQDRSTIAFYDREGNCDEVTGFVSATGKPKWYRTLTDNGPIEVASAPNVVLIVATTTVHVIDNADGIDRWMWSAPNGCEVDRSLDGSQGVLTSYHCGRQNHLMLHDLISSAVKWDIAVDSPMVPAAAGVLVGAADPATGTLTSYSTAKGTVTKRTALGPVAEVSAGLTALPRAQTTVESFRPAARLEFIRAGRVFSLGPNAQVGWSATATGDPLLVDDQLVAVPEGARVALRRSTDGHLERRITLSVDPGPNYRIRQVGSGLLAAGRITEIFG